MAAPSQTKLYRGFRTVGGNIQVFRVEDGRESVLPLRCKIGAAADEPYVGHSPTGFEIGYGGSGPAQLAFALLFDVLQDVAQAKRAYQTFKWQEIAKLDPDTPFVFSESYIRAVAFAILKDKETA